MQIPSDGVQPPMDKHMHLMCTHAYPLMAHLTLDQAVRYLMEAPTVVKQVAPMSWSYVSAPQDGTIWLEWLAPRQNNGIFPSDGYVWSDPEQAHRQDFSGYTVETLHHSAGFRPGIDHMTSHARTRYHLVAKAPQLNAPAPDPALWIVHYHQAAHSMIMPAVQLPVSGYTKHIMADRRQIESLGRIEQTSFMLHDREHWPRVTLPPGYGQQMHPQAMYGHPGPMPAQGGMMMAPRFQPFPNTGPPSAKRQRTHGPGPMLGPGEGMIPESGIEEEELTTYDYFDALTPRDISLERFKQHQQWMEEIFSSPYTTKDILPVDLGLGLMGELKGLTDGIVQEPSLDVLLKQKTRPVIRAKEASFTKLTQGQVDEFGTRVQKFLDDGKAEIERMKADHANKMRQWQKTHQLTQAERRLRVASWKDQKTNVFAVSADTSNGHDEEHKALPAEDIVQEVEAHVGLKARPHQDVALVEKGGLEEKRAAASAEQQQPPPINANAAELDGTASELPNGNVEVQADNDGGLDTNGQTTAQGFSTSQNLADLPKETADDNDMDMSLLQDDGMDLDTGDLNFELDDLAAQDEATSEPPAQDNSDTAIAAGSAAEPTAPNAAAGAGDTIEQNLETATPAEGDGMFDESGFDFADGAGNDDGDGLIDFESSANIGMDDSAFGDALHGMDKQPGDDTFAEQT